VLTVSGRPIDTVFDLLGRDENDLTYAFGWALANSPLLAKALLGDIYASDVGPIGSITLQAYGPDRGYTDLAIVGEHASVIIEAKRGWSVPELWQLTRYAPRLAEAANPVLLALTGCSPAFARRRLPSQVGVVPVLHRSWSEIVHMVSAAASSGPHSSRRLLRELERYLRGVMTMQNINSNLVYVVTLSADTPAGWQISFRDVVLERHRYFHPYGVKGKKWPNVPPNYLGLRWRGHVRQIRHIEGYSVVDDLNEAFDEIPAGLVTDPHIVYELGPPIELTPPRPNGRSHVTGHVRAAIDLLFTSATLYDAVAGTKAREAAGAEEVA
jgi:hypothetical protein